MRITLDIDPAVLQIAEEMATLRKTTAGKVISGREDRLVD